MNKENTKKIINKLTLKTIYDESELSMDKLFEDIQYVVSDLDDIISEFKISYLFTDTDHDCENIIYLNLNAQSVQALSKDASDVEITNKSTFQASLLENYISKHKGLNNWEIVDIKSSVTCS
jgi:hypothetical protein